MPRKKPRSAPLAPTSLAGLRSAQIRSRVVPPRRVAASSLVPHPLNPRLHGEGQRAALPVRARA